MRMYHKAKHLGTGLWQMAAQVCTGLLRPRRWHFILKTCWDSFCFNGCKHELVLQSFFPLIGDIFTVSQYSYVKEQNDNTSVTWNRISWVVYHLYSLLKPQCSESCAMGIKENHIEKENNSRSRWTPGREDWNLVIMISRALILTVLYLPNSRSREHCYCCLFVWLSCNVGSDTQALCLLDNYSTIELKPHSRRYYILNF